jgi:hypothetical protein
MPLPPQPPIPPQPHTPLRSPRPLHNLPPLGALPGNIFISRSPERSAAYDRELAERERQRQRDRERQDHAGRYPRVGHNYGGDRPARPVLTRQAYVDNNPYRKWQPRSM